VTSLDDLYRDYGQSPWIDNIRRDWLDDGTLAGLVARGVRGVTSNPSIFAKALASSAYDAELAGRTATDPEAVFEALEVADVRDACDVLAGVHTASREEFERGKRRYTDGFVSLEVSPHLARATAPTIEAARRLAGEVDRTNLMIKIPATREGLPAITETLGVGINVNVTLIFSLARYAQVLDAWLSGLELAASRGHDLASVASVASFFVSRVDSAVDSLLAEGDPRRGTTAVAQVAGAYIVYQQTVHSERAGALLGRGAQVQRPLWASTSVKNPAYDDLLYVNRIVADETVNTMPDATLAATLERGDFASSLLLTKESAHETADALGALGDDVSLEDVTTRLEADGVTAFVDSYDELLATVAAKLGV